MNEDDLAKKEELLTRWIDGELDEETTLEFERLMEGDPALRREAEETRRLGNLIRGEVPSAIDPPSPDLFNARIMKRIETPEGSLQETATAGPASTVIRPQPGIWGSLPWFIAGAAVITAAMIALQKPPAGGSRTGDVAASETANTYTPRDGVEVTTRYVPEASATIISLEGLDEVPSDHEIDGELVASYAPQNTPAHSLSNRPTALLALHRPK